MNKLRPLLILGTRTTVNVLYTGTFVSVDASAQTEKRDGSQGYAVRYLMVSNSAKPNCDSQHDR